MFQPVFVLRKCRPSVVWRIDVDALHLARKLLLERLERQQVVTKDQPVVEQIAITHPLRRMIRPLRLLQQNSWLQLRPLVLADPGEFEFLPVRHASFFFSPSRPVASRSSRSSLGVADFRRFSTVLICSAAGMSSGKVPPMRLIALRTSLPTVSWARTACACVWMPSFASLSRVCVMRNWLAANSVAFMRSSRLSLPGICLRCLMPSRPRPPYMPL